MQTIHLIKAYTNPFMPDTEYLTAANNKDKFIFRHLTGNKKYGVENLAELQEIAILHGVILSMEAK